MLKQLIFNWTLTTNFYLIPQSFDWLADFHLGLLQAIFSLLFSGDLL